MQVSVTGQVMDLIERVKDEKQSTEVMLYQRGNKQLVTCKYEGFVAKDFQIGETETIAGRLTAWSQNNGSVGLMVMAGK